MHTSLFSQIKQFPRLLLFSILLHLFLLAILMFSLQHTSAPKMPAEKKVDTVKAVIIDASVVEQEVQKLKQAEDSARQKKLEEQKKLQQQADAARQKRLQEEKRLAEVKRKEQQRKQEQAKKEKAEQLRKQQELAKLEKQKAELEKKKQAEQQRLAELEKKRKAEEAAAEKKKREQAEAARQKKLAEEAEARRKEQEAEMRRQMLAEEARMAKQSAENQRLLAQYKYSIKRKVQDNWQQPVNMTAGWSCVVLVEQDRFGEVLNVQLKQCNGSEAFKSTVERAVRKASPLPEAPNNDVFDRKIEFIFRPDV
ncbi:MAG TPA: cell envelope integrity protein TolA [Gammaproteobacteria bacterium]